MTNTFYLLPVEIWVKIVNFSNETSLLLTNKEFFEMLSLIDVEQNIFEYVIRNDYWHILDYVSNLEKISQKNIQLYVNSKNTPKIYLNT